MYSSYNNGHYTIRQFMREMAVKIQSDLSLATLYYAALESRAEPPGYPWLVLTVANAGIPGVGNMTNIYSLELFVDVSEGSGTDEATCDDIQALVYDCLKIGQTGGQAVRIPLKDFASPGKPDIGHMELNLLSGWNPARSGSRPNLLHRRAMFQINFNI